MTQTRGWIHSLWAARPASAGGTPRSRNVVVPSSVLILYEDGQITICRRSKGQLLRGVVRAVARAGGTLSAAVINAFLFCMASPSKQPLDGAHRFFCADDRRWRALFLKQLWTRYFFYTLFTRHASADHLCAARMAK